MRVTHRRYSFSKNKNPRFYKGGNRPKINRGGNDKDEEVRKFDNREEKGFGKWRNKLWEGDPSEWDGVSKLMIGV